MFVYMYGFIIRNQQLGVKDNFCQEQAKQIFCPAFCFRNKKQNAGKLVCYRSDTTKVGTEDPPPAETLSKGSLDNRVKQPST